jgi:cysteine desulfuration protein SufE
MSIQENPFGHSITTDDILESLTFFDGWEERYKYIIDLGKELPAMDESKRVEANLVRGCQSQVWIDYERLDDRFHFEVDSDAFIVKGLLGLVMAAYNNKSAEEIAAFEIEGYFDQLGLMKHLSMTRGNGLKAMVEKIRLIAQAA